MHYSRWQTPLIPDALSTRRVVILSGPRQCGKTTLAQESAKKSTKKNARYLTLDDVALRASALNDPLSFVQKPIDELLIIDEVQKAPELLSAIKKMVDENPKVFGQYLLTGSADIQSAPTVSESLAGRIAKISLRTLTQGEILGSAPNFLMRAFAQEFLHKTQDCNRDKILELALRGGYPEPLEFTETQRLAWHIDYIDALITRDLKDIASIRHVDAMRQLLTTLATWSSQFMDLSAIGAGLSIQRQALENYCSALGALYLVEKLPAWTKTDYDRVGKQSKIFMTDTGLMSSLLNFRFNTMRLDGNAVGKLIETYVFNELSSQIITHPYEYKLFHYRDRQKREIDFIVERSDGTLLGIEVKASTSVTNDCFKHLRWFQENLAVISKTQSQDFIGIVLYTGQHVLSFGKNLWAVPITEFH